jgi:TATA-box binding protein (TBP) (component of TFIID and TFIIIB)
MKRFKIVRDLEWGEDGEVKTLISPSGKTVLTGDYYHDKIDSQIEGFFAAFDYLGINYESETEVINEDNEQ